MLQLCLLVAMIRRWLSSPVALTQAGPEWLIPAVGAASPSFAGAPLGYADASWLMLAAAIVCWLGFLPIILHRLIFVSPKPPARAAPGLAILVSAPAAISLGLFSLTGHVDDGFRLTAFSSLFFALCVIAMGKRLFVSPFSRTWWSFTFPAAALASALLHYHEHAHGLFSAVLAMGVLAAATGVVALMWLLSLRSMLTAFRTAGFSPIRGED
jgi:tellurite resistance protein